MEGIPEILSPKRAAVTQNSSSPQRGSLQLLGSEACESPYLEAV